MKAGRRAEQANLRHDEASCCGTMTDETAMGVRSPMTLYAAIPNHRRTPRWFHRAELAIRGLFSIVFVVVPCLYGVVGLILGATWAMTGNQNPQLPRVLIGTPAVLTSVAYLFLAIAFSYLLFCPRGKHPRLLVFFPLFFTAISFAAAGGFLR